MAASPRTRAELFYASRLGDEPQGTVFAPGRLVLLGEHVDHQGGRVLAVPLRQGIAVAWGIRPDRRVAVHALNARHSDRFDADQVVRTGRRWSDLARGVFARLGDAGHRLPGLNLVVYGDLPARQGLASSAAFVTSILRAVITAIGLDLNPATLARDVAAIERDWAGVRCGTMDPYVIVVAEPGEVVHLDTRRLDHEILGLPPEVALEPVATGIERRLDDTPYNERLRELEEALRALRVRRPDVDRLVDLTPDAFADLEADVSEPARARARHVVTEVHRVERAVEALHENDAEELGRLMDACHESLRTDYASSRPEIDAQVEQLRAEPDVLGARLQGAGWGGSIAVLRREGRAASVTRARAPPGR